MLSDNSHEIVGKSLAMLGYPVRDRVTGVTGVVTSVGFDLYGCVQCIVHPGTDKEGKMLDSLWFDINRLEVTGDKPCMTNHFVAEQQQAQSQRPSAVAYAHGPADRPRG